MRDCHNQCFLLILSFVNRGFHGKAGSAFDIFKIKYGSSGIGGATGGDGGSSFECMMKNTRIIQVKGTTISDHGGFVIMLKFIGENGTSCSIGQLTDYTKNLPKSFFDISHPGYYLSHLSGGKSNWRGKPDVPVVNGLKFHWQKMPQGRQLKDLERLKSIINYKSFDRQKDCIECF